MRVRASYTVEADNSKFKNLDCYLNNKALEKQLGEMRDQAVRDFADACNKIALLGGKILFHATNDSTCDASVEWGE